MHKHATHNLMRTVMLGAQVLTAWALALGPAPYVAASQLEVIEDLFVGRHAIGPFGGIGVYQNLLLESEGFDQGDWTRVSLTATNGEPAPNTSTTAELLQNNGAPNGYAEQAVTIAAAAVADYTFSIWLQSNDRLGLLSSMARIARSSSGYRPTRTPGGVRNQYSRRGCVLPSRRNVWRTYVFS